MNDSKPRSKTKAISTGITGFDGILDGGYASNRVHLIEGQPGTGKTNASSRCGGGIFGAAFMTS